MLDKVPFRIDGESERKACQKTGTRIARQMLDKRSQRLVDSLDSYQVAMKARPSLQQS